MGNNYSEVLSMTIRKDDNRHLIQVSVNPELYEFVQRRCRELDMPIRVWGRELIRAEMNSPRVGVYPINN